MIEGVRDLGGALRFLRRHPRLWGWVIAPAVVTLVVLVAMIAGGVWLVQSWLGPLVDRLPGWLATVAEVGVGAVLIAALAAGGWIIFIALAGAIAGPFNELLSEAVEEQLTGRRGPAFSLAAFVGGALRGVAHAVRRLLVFVGGALLLFAIGLVPGVGTVIALALGAWIAGRAAAYDAYDAVLSRRALGYGAKGAYLAAHRSRSLGLGLGVTGLMLVPGVNLVALGLGAVGATLAVHELDARPTGAR